MALRILNQIRDAIGNLNPTEVRDEAERPITVGITASSNAVYTQVERFLGDPAMSAEARAAFNRVVSRTQSGGAWGEHHVQLVETGMPKTKGAIVFDPDRLDKMLSDVLDAHEDLQLALARRIPAFRELVITRIIRAVSKENAIFAIATAVPGIIPLLTLPLSVGEFASDTAFLTMNQIRMAFLIAAASGRDIGYGNQKMEIASIIAGAFGWRAIARELVGRIPLGGGLIPKGAIAYAGTYVVGLSIDKYFRLGIPYSEQERKAAYTIALERGKEIAGAIMANVRQKQRA